MVFNTAICSRCKADSRVCQAKTGAASCTRCNKLTVACDIALVKSQTQAATEHEQPEPEVVDESIRDDDYVVLPAVVIPRGLAVSGKNASQLSRRSYIRQHCPSFNNVRFVFPHSSGITLELWANKQILVEASPYWKDMFSSEMVETERTVKRRRVDVVEKKKWDDSDDERDDEVRKRQGSPSSVDEKDMRLPVHQVVVTEAAYTTYSVVLEWLHTGKIHFASYPTKAPVRSEYSTAAADSLTATGSPASVYSLAHYLDLAELHELALLEIQHALGFSAEAAAYILFSDAALRHHGIRRTALFWVRKYVARQDPGKWTLETTRRLAAGEDVKFVGLALELLSSVCGN